MLFDSGSRVKGQSRNIGSFGGRKSLNWPFEEIQDHRTRDPLLGRKGSWGGWQKHPDEIQALLKAPFTSLPFRSRALSDQIPGFIPPSFLHFHYRVLCLQDVHMEFYEDSLLCVFLALRPLLGLTAACPGFLIFSRQTTLSRFLWGLFTYRLPSLWGMQTRLSCSAAHQSYWYIGMLLVPGVFPM